MKKVNALILLAALLTVASPVVAGTTRQRLLTSNSEPYVGQALVLTLEIQRSDRATRLHINWPPLQDLALLETLPSTVRRLDGDPGQLIESLRRLVRPLRPGALQLSLKPAMAGENHTKQDLQIHVRPLPEQGRPQNFSGMVGTLNWQLDDPHKSGRRQVSLLLRGDVALEQLQQPLRSEDGGILTLLDQQRQGKGPQQALRMRYLYNPEGGGQGELSVSLNWFDPETGRYQSSQPPAPMNPWVILALAGSLIIPVFGLLTSGRRRKRIKVRAILNESNPLETRRQCCQKLHQAGATDELLVGLKDHWQQHDLRFSVTGEKPLQAFPRRRLVRELTKLIDKIDKL